MPSAAFPSVQHVTTILIIQVHTLIDKWCANVWVRREYASKTMFEHLSTFGQGILYNRCGVWCHCVLELPSLSNITWYGQSVMIPQHEDHLREQGQASSSIITTNCTSTRKDSGNVAKRTLRKQGSQGKFSNNTCQTKSELFPLAAKSTRSASQLRAKDLHNVRAERDAMRIALLLLPAMPSAPSSAPSAPTHQCQRRRAVVGADASLSAPTPA